MSEENIGIIIARARNQSPDRKHKGQVKANRDLMERLAQLLAEQLSAERWHGAAPLLPYHQLQCSIEEYHRLASQSFRHYCQWHSKWRNVANRLSTKLPLQAKRVAEKAFPLLCAFATHQSPDIRSLATRCLGSFQGLPENMIRQTLSKVPLTRWSGRTTTKQPGKAQKKSSAPPIAKQIDLFAAEGDVGLATAQDFGVVEQTSCGVFVLAMEDEFEQVRLAAISSIRQLGLSSLPFATEAVMHLIDMLNDDEYSVRLASIEALRDIFQKHAPQLKMNSEQLQQVQLAVDDPNSDYRKHCFHLFGSIQVTRDPAGNGLKALQSLLDQLLSLLRKYPKDLPLLLECFAQIGKSHGQLLGADTIHQLLFNYDRRFLPEKWRLNDARYLAMHALTWNALSEDWRKRNKLGLPHLYFDHAVLLARSYPNLYKESNKTPSETAKDPLASLIDEMVYRRQLGMDNHSLLATAGTVTIQKHRGLRGALKLIDLYLELLWQQQHKRFRPDLAVRLQQELGRYQARHCSITGCLQLFIDHALHFADLYTCCSSSTQQAMEVDGAAGERELQRLINFLKSTELSKQPVASQLSAKLSVAAYSPSGSSAGIAVDKPYAHPPNVDLWLTVSGSVTAAHGAASLQLEGLEIQLRAFDSIEYYPIIADYEEGSQFSTILVIPASLLQSVAVLELALIRRISVVAIHPISSPVNFHVKFID